MDLFFGNAFPVRMRWGQRLDIAVYPLDLLVFQASDSLVWNKLGIDLAAIGHYAGIQSRQICAMNASRRRLASGTLEPSRRVITPSVS